MTLTNQ